MRSSIRALFLTASATVFFAPACTLGQSGPDAAEEAVALSDSGMRRGKILFLQCQACHSLGAGEAHRVGPNLNGLFGRRAASADGFAYSKAMQDSDITWDAAQLDEFMINPTAKVPGTIMAFAGVPEAADRQVLVGYLKAMTAQQE